MYESQNCQDFYLRRRLLLDLLVAFVPERLGFRGGFSARSASFSFINASRAAVTVSRLFPNCPFSFCSSATWAFNCSFSCRVLVSLQAVKNKLSTTAAASFAQAFLRVIRHPSFTRI